MERRAAEAVFMSPENVQRFLEHLKRERRTEKYRRNLRTYLAHWAVPLADRDLRSVTLQELKKALAGWPTARSARIIALKSYCSYLREEEAVLTPAQDPTLALKVPPARASKKLEDRAYDLTLVERFYRNIGHQAVRDLLCVLAKTGLHATEADRIARGDGAGEVRAVEGLGEIAGTARLVHKNGDQHIQSLDAQALAALKRLVARGQIPVESFVRKEVKKAARALRVEPISFGRLRHCFITWGQEVGVEIRPQRGGVPLATIAAVVGHKDTRTTKKFYTGVAVPPMIRLPLRLEHPDDPVELRAALPTALARSRSS